MTPEMNHYVNNNTRANIGERCEDLPGGEHGGFAAIKPVDGEDHARSDMASIGTSCRSSGSFSAAPLCLYSRRPFVDITR